MTEWMEIPPLLIPKGSVEVFRTLPVDVQHGVIGRLRDRKIGKLPDDAEESIQLAASYQEFLRKRKLDTPVLEEVK